MSLRSKLNALIVLNVCNVTAESGLTRQNTACNEAMWATGTNWALGLDTDSWNTSWQLVGGEWTMYSPYHERPLLFHRFQTSSPSLSPRSSPHSRVNLQHRTCLPLASTSLVVSHAGYSTSVVTVTRITSVGKRNICRLPVGAFRQCILLRSSTSSIYIALYVLRTRSTEPLGVTMSFHTQIPKPQ